MVEESRGHKSLETIRSSSIDRGGRGSHGHKSQETTHSTSRNCGGRGRRSSFTSHSSSCDHLIYVDRIEYRSQETSHSSSCNFVAGVDVEGTGG